MGHYENTFIGSFLYGLGIEIGATSVDHPLVSGVDLLQQTPLDRSLADLLIKAPDYVSIIEFKRCENRDEKEANKRSWLKRMISASEEAHQRIAAISRAMHIQIDIKTATSDLVISRRPYIDDDSAAVRESLPEICRWFAAEMRQAPAQPTAAERAFYLEFLKLVNGEGSSASGGGSVLILAGQSGFLRHVIVDDLRDFYRTPRQIVELQERLSRERDRQLKPRQRNEPEVERSGLE